MQRLGASTRHEAAEIVLRWDAARNQGHDQDLVSQSPDLAAANDQGMFEEPWRSPMAERGAHRLREMRVTLGDFGEMDRVPHPSATGERQPHGRSPLQILAFVVGLTVAIAVVASAALPISQGFQALSNLVQPYRSR
jgi:hypothetical protein